MAGMIDTDIIWPAFPLDPGVRPTKLIKESNLAHSTYGDRRIERGLLEPLCRLVLGPWVASLRRPEDYHSGASEDGLRGYAAITMYCASKGAVVNLTRPMACELATEVTVNCVCPGVIDTDIARARGADALRDEADHYPRIAASHSSSSQDCFPP
jgi:NAD(P)-dependent dehydrogenase (short-subunit alcohol dehydrogenase family)